MTKDQLDDITITDKIRLVNMNRFLSTSHMLAGSIVEVGVYRGGSFYSLATANPTRQCYGYDTFEGLPKPGPFDNVAIEGQFDSNYCSVRHLFIEMDNVIVVKGLYPYSDYIRPTPVVLAHIDVDLYSSTLEACQWLAPAMATGSRIYCDDAGIDACQGATRAFVEFAQSIERPVLFDNDFHWFIQF